MRKTTEFLIAGIFIVSCGAGLSEAQGKVQTVSLKEEMTLGENDADEKQVFFNLIGSFVDAENNYYLLDKGNFRIQVFNKNGEFIRTIGNKGQGPGEFVSIVAGSIYDRKYVLVADDSLLRANVYDLEGQFLSSFQIKGKVSDLICTPDNRIFMAYPDAEGRLVHEYNIEGKLMRSFGVLPEKELLLFNDVVKMSMGDEGDIYLCIRYANRIHKYDSNGHLVRQVEAELPFEVPAKETKGGAYRMTAVFLDIAFNGNDVHVITAPQISAQGSIMNALKESNHMIVLDKDLNRKRTVKLPYLALSLCFDNDGRLLLSDIDFVFRVCSF